MNVPHALQLSCTRLGEDCYRIVDFAECLPLTMHIVLYVAGIQIVSKRKNIKLCVSDVSFQRARLVKMVVEKAESEVVQI